MAVGKASLLPATGKDSFLIFQTLAFTGEERSDNKEILNALE